jgi:hypothetical protein
MTRHSSINHQLDRIDVRRVVGGKEKHSFGQFFRFAPAAQSNRGGDEVSELSRLLGGIVGAEPTLPDGSLGCSGCDNVDANIVRSTGGEPVTAPRLCIK